MRNKVLDPRLARREAESRVCRGRGDDELFSASLKNRGFSLASQGSSKY